MDTIKLWARHGDAVRQAIELGELVHLETASEELTDEFLLFALQSGLLAKWAETFPDPRQEPEIDMEVILASHLAARCAGLYSMRKSGYVLRSAAVLGAWAIVWKCGSLSRASRCGAPRMTSSSAAMCCANSWCSWNTAW